MTISEILLPEFDKEMAATRRMLAVVPEDAFGWKPHEKSMTLGRLAGHVAEMPAWGLHTLAVETLDLTPPGGEPMKGLSAESQAQLLEAFDKAVAEARPLLAKTSDEEMQKTWTLIYKGHTVLSMPRSEAFRTLVVNHMIHHRGQLSVYLRLKETAVPGMYGPSADEAKGF